MKKPRQKVRVTLPGSSHGSAGAVLSFGGAPSRVWGVPARPMTSGQQQRGAALPHICGFQSGGVKTELPFTYSLSVLALQVRG